MKMGMLTHPYILSEYIFYGVVYSSGKQDSKEIYAVIFLRLGGKFNSWVDIIETVQQSKFVSNFVKHNWCVVYVSTAISTSRANA